MKKIPPAFLLVMACTFFMAAGCLDTVESPPVTPLPVTTLRTVPTPAPVKEVVYVYITVTVTPSPPTTVPTPTRDFVARSDLPAYNAWRYQTVSKEEGILRFGPVSALLVHLNKAPDKQSYELYYDSGRRWKEELVLLITTATTSAPPVRSAGMRSAITNYSSNLTVQNQSIRTLDRVLTNWQFSDAGRVTNGIVLNITNATRHLDEEIAILT